MELHNYQKRIIERIKSTDRLILSVGMGLGKTAAVLHYIAEAKPKSVIIVAPKRVAETVWLQEANKWRLTEVADKMIICTGGKKKRWQAANNSEKTYKIISRDNVGDLEGAECDLLVLDELTSFKQVVSKRSESVRKIRANKKVGLTGSFIANGYIDIFGQAAAVGLYNASIKIWRGKRISPEYQEWRSRYFVDKLAGSGLTFQKWEPVVPLNDILSTIVQNVFTLDSADYLSIPPVTYREHKIELTANEYKTYKEFESLCTLELSGQVLTFDDQQKFIKLQTLCNGFVYEENGEAVAGKELTKLNAVADFVASCKAEGESVLLFFAFRYEAMLLAQLFTARGLSFCSIKDPYFLRKWEGGEVDVLMAHPASAGHGLNMQKGGRFCVWSSVTYNYEYWKQANARLARQGQENKVQIHTFTTSGTIEQKQLSALKKKEIQNQEFVNLTK